MSPGMMPRCAISCSSVIPYSSDMRSWTVARRQVACSRLSSYTPRVMFVLPMSIARNMQVPYFRLAADFPGNLPVAGLENLVVLAHEQNGGLPGFRERLVHHRIGHD